jgi:predicted nucleic acid-binding protein
VTVIVDTGPLVAALDERDRHHAWAIEVLARVRAPLATCDAVLSEVGFLVERARPGAGVLAVELVERGVARPSFRLADECVAVAKLMRRYAEVPMSLADACLVRMSELEPNASVLTLDEDFRVYRRNGRSVIKVIAPWVR